MYCLYFQNIDHARIVFCTADRPLLERGRLHYITKHETPPYHLVLRTPGVTVLAWGAQVPDCLASVAMAKKGLGAPSLPPSLAPRRAAPLSPPQRRCVPLFRSRVVVMPSSWQCRPRRGGERRGLAAH